ncbi:DUF2752 domain-containing protein [Streptomyces sp. NPDC006540]|uniref:DUF2752 domain-containing protein n=1 Tax=Streptomyces sp. NPDC006540 TaxID=3155353 RepID=UPI0033A391C9
MDPTPAPPPPAVPPPAAVAAPGHHATDPAAVPGTTGPTAPGQAPGEPGQAAGPAPRTWPAGAVPAAFGRSAPSTARRVAAPLAVLAGVAAAFAYVGTVDPNEPGHYPVCPLLRFTGIYCPGCGGLRSAHAFVHGDIGAALGANAVAVVGYAVFAVVWVVWLIRAVQGRPLRIGLSAGWWWVMGGALVIFSVVRNLPFGSALAP